VSGALAQLVIQVPIVYRTTACGNKVWSFNVISPTAFSVRHQPSKQSVRVSSPAAVLQSPPLHTVRSSYPSPFASGRHHRIAVRQLSFAVNLVSYQFFTEYAWAVTTKQHVAVIHRPIRSRPPSHLTNSRYAWLPHNWSIHCHCIRRIPSPLARPAAPAPGTSLLRCGHQSSGLPVVRVARHCVTVVAWCVVRSIVAAVGQ